MRSVLSNFLSKFIKEEGKRGFWTPSIKGFSRYHGFRPLQPLSTSSVAPTETPSDLPPELEQLKPLDKIFLNQSTVRYKRLILTTQERIHAHKKVEIEAVSSEKKLLFKIEFLQGSKAKEYLINVFGLGDDKPLLAEMGLERCIQQRGFILRVRSPPGRIIGSIYELSGITQVAIVENEKQESILQIITNGGFGWATSATILNGTGAKVLGKMQKIKPEIGNALFTTITFPSITKTSTKLTLIGACLTFMGRYHF